MRLDSLTYFGVEVHIQQDGMDILAGFLVTTDPRSGDADHDARIGDRLAPSAWQNVAVTRRHGGRPGTSRSPHLASEALSPADECEGGSPHALAGHVPESPGRSQARAQASM